MILTSPTRTETETIYRIYPVRDPELFLYGSAKYSYYCSTLAMAICRKNAMKVAFFIEDPDFIEVVRTKGDYTWWTSDRAQPASGLAEYNFALRTETGVVLYPCTRDGLEDAARLFFYAGERRWCRLFIDANYRESLSDGLLTPDEFQARIDALWVVAIRNNYEVVVFEDGPQASALAFHSIEEAISETNTLVM